MFQPQSPDQLLACLLASWLTSSCSSCDLKPTPMPAKDATATHLTTAAIEQASSRPEAPDLYMCPAVRLRNSLKPNSVSVKHASNSQLCQPTKGTLMTPERPHAETHQPTSNIKAHQAEPALKEQGGGSILMQPAASSRPPHQQDSALRHPSQTNQHDINGPWTDVKLPNHRPQPRTRTGASFKQPCSVASQQSTASPTACASAAPPALQGLPALPRPAGRESAPQIGSLKAPSQSLKEAASLSAGMSPESTHGIKTVRDAAGLHVTLEDDLCLLKGTSKLILPPRRL